MKVLFGVLAYVLCALSAASQQKENARLKTANRALLKVLKEIGVSMMECYPGMQETCPSPSVCHQATARCVDPMWKVASKEEAVAAVGITECYNNNDAACEGLYVCRNSQCVLPVLDVKSTKGKAVEAEWCYNDNDAFCKGFYICRNEKCVLPLLVQKPQASKEMAVGKECYIDAGCSGSYVCWGGKCMLPVLAMNPSEETAVGRSCYYDTGCEGNAVCYNGVCAELAEYII